MTGKKGCLDVLPDLLKYAKTNVPFYTNIKKLDLHGFPVVNKTKIMANFNDFQSIEFINKRIQWGHTSGSTGTPFKFNYNRDKRNRTIADLIYFHKLNGWQIGERYVFLRAWTSDYSVSSTKMFLQNFKPFESVNFDHEAKERMKQKLVTDKKVKVILGYASSMEDFVNYLEEKDCHADMFNVRVIFTDSDDLSVLTKHKLEKMFGCPVINRYSNEEHGLLACTSTNDQVFRLNTASFFFELLKLDSDEPADPGEIGRVIVTDLYNHSMPFIRYDTGDLAVSNDPDRQNLKTINNLQGRVADSIRDIKGNVVTAVMVNNYLEHFEKVTRYQLIQDEENHYILKVICKNDAYSSSSISNKLKKILGATANIEIEYVDYISVEQNGKFKTVKNLITRPA